MAVVLEIVERAAPEHDVCQDVTTEAVQHGAEPGGHRTPARNLNRACRGKNVTMLHYTEKKYENRV